MLLYYIHLYSIYYPVFYSTPALTCIPALVADFPSLFYALGQQVGIHFAALQLSGQGLLTQAEIGRAKTAGDEGNGRTSEH